MFAFITHNSIVQDLCIVKRSIQNMETKKQMKMLVNQLTKYSENNEIIPKNRNIQTQTDHVKSSEKSCQTITNNVDNDNDDDFEYLE